MARYRFTAYQNDAQPRYIVLFGPQREIIGCQRLEAAADLRGAMAAAMERLANEGWEAEGSAEASAVASMIWRCGLSAKAACM